MDIDVQHDPERRRFTARVGGTESSLLYAPAGTGVVNVLSTWVDPTVRGHRVGEHLVLAALEWARAEGLGVIPSCWFVGTVVEWHPEYRDLLRA